MFAHVDADAFFASVLQRKHPHLRGKPLLALGMGGGCVIAASYEAKAKGVKTGMRLTDALALCPEALRIPSDFRETGLASQQIETILRDTCPIIEQMSIDEWYLDLRTLVGGMPAETETWARGIQKRIVDETALSVSVGVAPTKLLAKMVGEYRKPAGVSVIGPTLSIEQFLRDRVAQAIPGIGRRRSLKTDAYDWKTAWDFANADRGLVARLFGKQGPELQRELLGEALFEITREEEPPKSVSRCRSFRPTNDVNMLWAYVLQHLQYTILKMRRHGLACRGVSVWLRDGKYEHRSSHSSLPKPADTEEAITPHARACFLELYEKPLTYTQTGFGLWHLLPKAPAQFSLFEEPKRTVRGEDLQESLDAVRAKFGRNSIHRGAALMAQEASKPGLGLPILGED